MIRQTLSSKAPLWVALTLLLTLSGCDEVVLFDPFTPDTFNQEFPTRVLVRSTAGGYTAPIGGADGKDWDTAFTDINEAIDYAAAHGIGEVWVAGGTYTITTTITPVEGVSLYGGFKVGDSFYDDRDPHRGGRTTTLSRANGYQLTLNGTFSRQLIIDGFTFTGTGSSGIYLFNGASPTIRNCRFIQNATSAGSSTALFINGTGTSPLIENCRFSGFFTGSNNVINCANSCQPVFVGCHFTGNRSTSNGGVIYYNSAVPLTLTDCHFTGNQTTLNGSHGGAIYLGSGQKANLTRCTFTDNKATVNISFGGAIFTSSNATLDLTGCTFTGNSAATSGGAIYIGANSTLNISATRFINNSADGGGAIYLLNDASATLTGCNLTGNYVSGDLSRGGAINVQSATIEIQGCHFTGNGINPEGSPVTYSGGAISLSESGITCDSGTTFTGNKSTNHGGAVSVETALPGKASTFENCTFTGNQSEQRGGAIYFYDCESTSTLRDCRFTDNRITAASDYLTGGGGVFFAHKDSPQTLNATRCTFTGNTATNSGTGGAHGGGLYKTNSAVINFLDCTDGGENNPEYYYTVP